MSGANIFGVQTFRNPDIVGAFDDRTAVGEDRDFIRAREKAERELIASHLP